MSHVIPTSISRTALDSLHAKLSAIDGGWLDGGNECPAKNDGTSQPISGSILDSYYKLLQHIHHTGGGVDSSSSTHQAPPRRRRQTPLVNAGYASRMAVMTYILEQWINQVVLATTNCDKNGCIVNMNIVLVGCGMDVLGVWSKYVLQQHVHNNNNFNSSSIQVYEFDAWDNCILKRQSMVKSELLEESFSFESSRRISCNNTNIEQQQCDSSTSCSIMSKGKIRLERSNDDCAETPTNEIDDYHLVALDLRETCASTDDDDGTAKHKSVLSHAIQHLGLDTSRPTIVLSELVLAYLGYEGANATMETISNDLLYGNEYSMFACLEPVFPSDALNNKSDASSNDSNITKILSVEESYSIDYSQQFLGKLQRGNSKDKPNNNDSSSTSWLHPLGSNSQSIKRRFKQCGLSHTCYTTLGKAAATVARIRRTKLNEPNFLRAKEAFDEHAALALNLNCYGVVCAFSTDCCLANNKDNTGTATTATNTDWKQHICPWRTPSTVQIYPIATLSEDNQVRDMYSQIYVSLYDDYPAIRKMVKSALKMDLSMKGPAGAKQGQEQHQLAKDCSVIRHRFTEKGGDFWVVKDTAANKSRIIGCVGVSQQKKRIADNNNDVEESTISFSATPPPPPSPPTTVVEYEIQRLAVDDSYRGKGIGRKLLSIAEEYARNKESERTANMTSDTTTTNTNTNTTTIKVWATTPSSLIAANKVYEAMQYKQVETFQAGSSLCMNVYCKILIL